MGAGTLLGVAVAIVILGIVALAVVVLRSASIQDLGTVSRQWIVEQRASQSDDTPR